MKKTVFIIICVVLLSCKQNPVTYIEHLNGYWEIDEVTLPDGTKKDYTFSDTVDFISVTDSLTGIRKKMKPNLNGTYSTSNDEESFKLKIENDSLNMYYETPFSQWKETVIKASEDQLIIQNQNKLRYVYKRYEPLDFN